MNHSFGRPTVLALAAMLACQEAAAQANPESEVRSLETVTITATRTSTLASDVPASISVINSATMEKQIGVSADAFDALVKYVPGLETNNETSFDTSGKGPQLRGRAASVLINGVPVNTLLRSSGFTLGLVDSYAIDRIEVNRGATAAFGFGAPGGLISITTRRGDTPTPEVQLRTSLSANPRKAGDSLSAKAYLGVGQRTEGMDYHVGLAAGRDGPRFGPSGEPITSQDVNVYNIDGAVGLRLGDKGRVELSANFFRRDFRANYVPASYNTGFCINNDFDACPIGGPPTGQASKFDDPGTRGMYQQNHIVMARLTHEVFGQALDAAVYSMSNSFRYSFPSSDFADPPTIGVDRNEMKNDRYGLRTSLTASFGPEKKATTLTYGIDYQRDKLIRLRFQGPDVATNDVTEVRPFSPPVLLDSYALFAQGNAPVGDWIFSGGVRRESFRPKSEGYSAARFIWPEGRLPSFGATSFNAGALYKLSPKSEAYVSVSQGLEVSELGRVLRAIAVRGTPADLSRAQALPAKTTQYELGMRSRAGAFNWSAAVFYVNAPLSAQADCSVITEPCRVVRQPEKSWGAEVTADWRLNTQWSVGGNFTWQDGNYTDESGVKHRQTSDRITPPRLNAYATLRPAPGWETTASVTHVFDRKPFEAGGQIPNGVFPQEGNVSGYTTADLLVSKEFGSASTLSLGIENLFNARYIPVNFQASRDLYNYHYAEGTRLTLSYSTRF